VLPRLEGAKLLSAGSVRELADCYEFLRRTENRLTMHLLDRRWSAHLALVEDIREGIHLQRLGGREPITEFHRQIVTAYASMMDSLREEVLATFSRLAPSGGAIDLERAGVQGPSSTWTYLVNDNPFSTFGISLIAGRSVGYSAAVGLVAAMYWPIIAVTMATAFLRRRIHARRSGAPPASASDDERR